MSELSWTLLVIAIMAVWIASAIRLVIDIVRSADRHTIEKVVWILAILVFPLIGLALYVVIDVLRRDDLTRGATVGWAILAIVVPLIGVSVYAWFARKPPAAPVEVQSSW
jgi:hypothetical protein